MSPTGFGDPHAFSASDGPNCAICGWHRDHFLHEGQDGARWEQPGLADLETSELATLMMGCSLSNDPIQRRKPRRQAPDSGSGNMP